MSRSLEAGSRRACGGEAWAPPWRGAEGEGRLGGKVGSGRWEPGIESLPQFLAGSSREEGAAGRGGGHAMPKVFLVKRRSPGVSVRSWDELPDEERADTYIPGERRAGAGAWARDSRSGGRGGRVHSAPPLGLDSPPLAASFGAAGRGVLLEEREDGE